MLIDNPQEYDPSQDKASTMLGLVIIYSGVVVALVVCVAIAMRGN